jgi:hypothetical protein
MALFMGAIFVSSNHRENNMLTEEELRELHETTRRMRELVDKAFPHTPYPAEPSPYVRQDPKCPKCGITLAPIMGYVCGQSDCPTGLGGNYTLAGSGVMI